MALRVQLVAYYFVQRVNGAWKTIIYIEYLAGSRRLARVYGRSQSNATLICINNTPKLFGKQLLTFLKHATGYTEERIGTYRFTGQFY